MYTVMYMLKTCIHVTCIHVTCIHVVANGRERVVPLPVTRCTWAASSLPCCPVSVRPIARKRNSSLRSAAAGAPTGGGAGEGEGHATARQKYT